MKTLLIVIAGMIALASLFLGIDSAPLRRNSAVDPKEIGEAVKTLVKIGYLNKTEIESDGEAGKGGALDSPAVVQAITDLQMFGGLTVTGSLTPETLDLLKTDRCGMKDPKLNVTNRAGGLTVGRYYLQGTRWQKRDLTYRFISFTSDIRQEDQKRVLRKMIQKWAAASTLTITEQNDPAVPDDDVDILIRFVRGYHGDPYSFDGPGGTLAHAYYPHNNKGLSGDAHFDDDERFTTGTSDGINLDWVAVHEFGHSMGLEHSNVRESIMYPWYKGYQGNNIELTYDDIQGIQALYGAPTPTDPPTNPPTDPPTDPQTDPPTDPPTDAPTDPPTDTPTDPPTDPPTVHPACRPSTKYDAVVVEEDTRGTQVTHFFHGDSFWTLSRRLERSEAKKVKDYFPEVTTPISAAYLNADQYVVIFSGSSYWEYEKPLDHMTDSRRRVLRRGSITQYGLSSSLANMDAVFTWYKNKKTYIFKGSQYWRYNHANRRIDFGYPKNIAVGWPDLPDNLDAAVTWSNTRSYVFKGNNYWRLSTTSRNRKLYADKGYPREVAKIWMKCKTESVSALQIGALQNGP